MAAFDWTVIGAGSMGRLFAGRLRDAGIGVTLLRRGERTPQVPRCLLVAVKTPDTLAALAPHVAGDGSGQLGLLLQNGMGTAGQVRARWPQLRLWHAVTTAAAWRDAQDELHVVTIGETQFGRADDAGDAGTDAAVEALCTAGIGIRVADIRTPLWRKLAVNALINPLTALHGVRNGELATNPELRALLPPLAAEIDAVARAEGVTLDTLAGGLDVIARTAANWSSMNRDLAAGRPTEIDSITGYLLACARRHGIATPQNARLLAAIRARVPPPAGA